MNIHTRKIWRSIVAIVVLVLSVSGISKAAGQEPKIAGISADRNQPARLDIIFDIPYPSQSDVNSKDYWIVFAKDKKGTITKLDVKSVDSSALAPGSTDEKKVVLEFAFPMSLDTTSVDVTLANQKVIVHAARSNPFGSGSAAQPTFKACKGKTDCDIYITGSYTASVGATPLFSIDSFAGYMRTINNQKNYGKIGFYGQVQEKSSSTLNPDSFLAYLDYQYVLNGGSWFGPFQAPIFNYRIAGTEFNKTGDDVNFVNSPMVTLPIRLSGKSSGPVTPGITSPLLSVQLGAEFVDVTKSVLAPTGTWHTRGLIGATFAGGIPIKKAFLYSILLTSSYQLRLPSTPEIYFDPKFAPINPTTGKAGATPPLLGMQPRHYVDTKLTYNLVEWFGFTFEHTYGSLPPSFVKTNQTFSLGLTFALAGTGNGRNSILKP